MNDDQEWQNILASQPCLAADVHVYPHVYRHVDWYLLVNQLTNTQVMVEQVAYDLLRRLDGDTSVESALQDAAADQAMPLDKDDVVLLLSSLLDAELLTKDTTEVLRSAANTESPFAKIRARTRSVFSIKIPLLDPHELLGKLLKYTSWCFSARAVALFSIIIVLAAATCLNRWPELVTHWGSRFQDPTNLLWLVVLYPLVKTLHEFGHGLAARHWGAEVHEMGVMLLVFMPVPYVDASATAAFYSPRRRMSVAAAGIIIESVVASLAILAWFNTGSGVLSDVLFNIAVVGGVSTLLFNGNPLLRFDGYYVLSDMLQIPNLGPRASGYLSFLFRSYCLGLTCYKPPLAPGEARWLVLYGVCSSCYRVLIGFAITLYVTGLFFIFGLLLAVWYFFVHMLRPLFLSVLRTLPMAKGEEKLGRYGLVMGMIFILLPLLVFTVPLPHSTVAPGIILPPETSHLRAGTSGWLIGVAKDSGDQVTTGETVFVLQNEELALTKNRLRARQEELEARSRQALTSNRLDYERLEAESASASAELQEIQREIAQLQLKAPVPGRFAQLSVSEQFGQYFRKGDVLGYVIGHDDWTARVMVPQADIDDVMEVTRRSEVISQSDPFNSSEASFETDRPRARDSLPARSLGTLGGGFIMVDARDESGTKLVDPMYEVTMRLPGSDYLVGETILVRFPHNSEPIGKRFFMWLTGEFTDQIAR